MTKPIFTDDFLKPYLDSFRLSAIPDLQHKKAILQNWHEAITEGKFLKEEEAKSRFVTEIFGDVLGFNYKNATKWQIKEEHKSVVGSTKPDAALGQFKVVDKGDENEVHIVVEVKGPKILLDKAQNRKTLQITPVDQSFLYASKAGGNCKWVIVTNFSEIRFYHYSGQESYQGFTIAQLQQEATLKQFLFLFHKDRLTNSVKASTEKLFELRGTITTRHQRDMHILDELYFTLKNFDGLGFVDPNFLCNIRPFNVRDHRVWHFENGTFLTLNQQISELIQGFVIENEVPVFLPDYIKALKKAKIAEPVEKLTSVLKFLSNCAVTKIYVFKDIKDQIRAHGGPGALRQLKYVNRDHLISIDPGLGKRDNCQCLNCTFRTLNFKTLIKKIKDAETQNSMEPLEEAYGHYLLATDNFKKAYFLYKKSELTLTSASNKVGYFIAKINQGKLPNLITSYGHQPDKSILDDIKSIDLDRSLYQELDFYVDEDVRKYLIEVKENRLFLNLKESINEIARKVDRKAYDQQDLNTLHWNYNLLHFYFHKNYFVFDIFSDYKDLVTTIFRAFILAYSQPEPMLSEFPEFYLIEAVIYIDTREFKKIIELAGDIKVEKEKGLTIAGKAINLLQSQNQPAFLGNYMREDNLSAQLLNYHFQDTYTRIFSNVFTLLSKIEFAAGSLPSGLAQPITGIILTEDFLSGFDLAELGDFIERYGSIFKVHELLDMLKHAIRNNFYGINKYDAFIESIAIAHYRFYPETKIRDIGLMKTAIGNASDQNGKCNPRSLLLLCNIFDEEGSTMLLEVVSQSLSTDFNDMLYLKMLGHDIVKWDEGNLFDLYVADVNRHKGRGMILKEGVPTYDNYYMHNLINQLYFRNIPFDTLALLQLNNLTEFETWAINPFIFDYNQFKPEWLLALDTDNVLEKISSIKTIGKKLYNFLQINFDPRLSEIYFKYFAAQSL